MPKVEYTHGKGLFQSSGTGVELSGGANDELTLSMKVLQETAGFANATTNATTFQIPAGAIVMGCRIDVVTADTNTSSVTHAHVATTTDAVAFGVQKALDISTAGETQTWPSAALGIATAAQTLTVTWEVSDGTDTAPDGDGTFKISVFYMAVA